MLATKYELLTDIYVTLHTPYTYLVNCFHILNMIFLLGKTAIHKFDIKSVFTFIVYFKSDIGLYQTTTGCKPMR